MKQILSTKDVPWQALLRDPYVIAAVVLMVLVSAPLAIPSFDTAFWSGLYLYYFDAPILALTAFVLWTARGATAVGNYSSRFWSRLTAGFLFWLAIRLLGPLLTGNSPVATLATDLLYLAFYLFLILAFQLRPHLTSPDSSANLIRQLELTGATLFAFGMLVYFAVIPATYNPSSLLTNVPSTMLYMVLNLYLFARALALRNSWGHDPWRGCYNWLVWATGGFVLLDGFDLATRISESLDAAVPWGTLLESLWLLPLLGFIAAARLYTLSPSETRSTSPEEHSEALVWKWRGRLTYFALVPPLVHIILEILGWSDEQTRSAREFLVVIWVISAAGLNFLYDQRLLRQQQALEQRHLKVNQQLEVAQRMDAVRRMAGGIAHDFNNLLMVIQGFAELLASRLRNTDDRSDAEEIAKASERAGQLTRKLLALGNREKAGIQPFLPNDVLHVMEKTLQRLTNFRIEMQLNETGYVLGEKGAFQDAILNLVLNARQAICGGGSVKLTTGKLLVASGDLLADTLGPGSYGFAVVEDTGKGMDEETLRHVFEPFFSNREGGTGLGLSMVYSFAQEAGGTVEVDSRLGEGTRFRIILPESYAPRESDRRDSVPSTVGGHPRTILLVEDEDSVRSALRQSLQNAGMNVLEARNGKDALDILTQTGKRVDLIITDVVMPEMDGGSLARHLQKIDPTLPIIFMTGHAAGQLDRLGDRVGMTQVLRKPFGAKELLLEIERRLDPFTKNA